MSLCMYRYIYVYTYRYIYIYMILAVIGWWTILDGCNTR